MIRRVVLLTILFLLFALPARPLQLRNLTDSDITICIAGPECWTVPAWWYGTIPENRIDANFYIALRPYILDGSLIGMGAARTTETVPDWQTNTIWIPAGSRAFETDARGNFLIGPNELLASPDGSDSNLVADFLYSADKRRAYLRSLICTEVGDPCDIAMGRVPGTYPIWPSGEILPGESLGNIYWRGWVPGVGFQGQAAMIGGRAMETPSPTSQAGSLSFSTTAYGSTEPTPRVRIQPDGSIHIAAALSTPGSEFPGGGSLYVENGQLMFMNGAMRCRIAPNPNC